MQICRRWNIRKLERKSKKVESKIQQIQDLHQKSRIRVETLSAKIDRITSQLESLEEQYVEYSDREPPASLVSEITTLDETLTREREILEQKKADTRALSYALQSAENTLVGLSSELERLRANFDAHAIMRNARALGLSQARNVREQKMIDEEIRARQDVQKSRKQETPSTKIASLEKTRREIQAVRALEDREPQVAHDKEIV